VFQPDAGGLETAMQTATWIFLNPELGIERVDGVDAADGAARAD
jgi:hypothetical protein